MIFSIQCACGARLQSENAHSLTTELFVHFGKCKGAKALEPEAPAIPAVIPSYKTAEAIERERLETYLLSKHILLRPQAELDREKELEHETRAKREIRREKEREARRRRKKAHRKKLIELFPFKPTQYRQDRIREKIEDHLEFYCSDIVWWVRMEKLWSLLRGEL